MLLPFACTGQTHDIVPNIALDHNLLFTRRGLTDASPSSELRSHHLGRFLQVNSEVM
jgi:hypothetical protein